MIDKSTAEQVAQHTLQERLRWLASQTFTHGGGMCDEAADELDRLTAINAKLLAALEGLYAFVAPLNDFRPDSKLARDARAAIAKARGEA
jgi:hypothetical protein